MRERVAKALFNKGVTLSRLNDVEQAIAVYDEVLRRFGGTAEPGFENMSRKRTAERDKLQSSVSR